MENVTSTLEIFDIEKNDRIIIYSEDDHFEAPNWSRDGSYLIINSKGKLFQFDLQLKKKTLINTGFANQVNNDHGISPDGSKLVISHHGLPDSLKSDGKDNGSRIYILPITGGTPRLITPKAPSYWHGWSPDGQTLAYVAQRNNDYDIYAIGVEGGEEIRLTNELGLDDGPDYSADGKHIYYNSMKSGKMEIWRMQHNGKNKEQLTNDKYSNWFPHPSPDGNYFVFISYLEPQGDRHPPMKNVALRLYDLENNSIRTLCKFTGGQGTINVPSWSPDSKRFAFVSYKMK
jgi:Tol biopolymer transport system component